jgi:hypothetical protein
MSSEVTYQKNPDLSPSADRRTREECNRFQEGKHQHRPPPSDGLLFDGEMKPS